MPIDAKTLLAHSNEHGPFLFHVTGAREYEAIARSGLRPGSELGHFVHDDFFRTRPGHVSICDRRRGVPVVPAAGERLTLQVDLEADIRRFGYEKNRAGEWESRDLAMALADLAQAVHDFDRALGWDPDACVAIAEQAASCLPRIAAAGGRDNAVGVARRAMASAA